MSRAVRLLLTAVATVAWSLGWAVGRTLVLTVAAVAWLAAACSLGYRDARPGKPRPVPAQPGRVRADGRVVA